MQATGSSLTMRVLPRTLYDFSNLGLGTAMTIVVAQHIDASVFQEADLHVRLHPGTVIANSSSWFTIGLVPDGYDFDDPAPLAAGAYADFLGATPTRTVPGAFQVLGTTTFPFFTVVSLNQSSAFGRLLAVTLYASQQGTGGTALKAVLSLDLVLKSREPRDLPAMPNAYCGYRII
jgi:hypothetical protein